MDIDEETKIKFNMLTGEKREIDLPYKEMIVILEGLYNLKKDIEEFKTNNILSKMRFENKLEEVNYLIETLETKVEYDFHKHLDKCINRKEKQDDAGMDALSAAVILKEKSEK